MESAMLRDGRKGYLSGGEEKYRMEIPDGSFGTAMTVNQVPFQQSSHLGKCAFDGRCSSTPVQPFYALRG
jgi:hypothetical protein